MLLIVYSAGMGIPSFLTTVAMNGFSNFSQKLKSIWFLSKKSAVRYW
jgi:cytochrome c biogenesis protein CcdA